MVWDMVFVPLFPRVSVTDKDMEYVPEDVKESATEEVVYVFPLIVHWYVSVPVPPEDEVVNVTFFPTSVGFCDDEIVTVGSGLTVSLIDAVAVLPSESLTVRLTEYVPAAEKEYEKEDEVLSWIPLIVQV